MSSNGRRRWRKWARNHKCWDNATESWFNPCACCLRRRGPTNGDPPPGPLPRPAFAARSLVGMSQSARKRAARKCLPSSTHAEECYKGTVAPDGQRAYVKWFHVPRCPIAKYRIGERLRPCEICGNWSPNDPVACHSCGGHQVLPARKARKARG